MAGQGLNYLTHKRKNVKENLQKIANSQDALKMA